MAAFVSKAFGIAFLNIITIGLYKPYGLTATRRMLYNNIWLGGEAMHYHGTPRGLSQVTFYPSLVFLFMVLVPGVLQFYMDFFWIATTSILQFLGVIYFYHYLYYRNKQYEWSQLTWRTLFLNLNGSAIRYANRAFLMQGAQFLSFGLLAPLRRRILAHYLYNNATLGRWFLSLRLPLGRLYMSFLLGWVLSVIGACVAGWYYWRAAVLPVQNVLNGGEADLSLANNVDADAFSAASGIGGAVDPATLAQIGTFVNAITLAFVLYPAWMVWRKAVFAYYESLWHSTLADHLECPAFTLRYDATEIKNLCIDSLAFFINFSTANLFRPFSTYLRFRALCRSYVVILNTENVKIVSDTSTLSPQLQNGASAS